jgi:hypothetical protein
MTMTKNRNWSCKLKQQVGESGRGINILYMRYDIYIYILLNKSFHRTTNKNNPPVKTGTQSDKPRLHQHHSQQSRTAAKTQRPYLTTY